MAKNLIQTPLIFQDENSNIYFKKGVITGKSKSGKPEAVKKATGLKSRNVLNDIMNKSTALPEEAAKKKSSQKEVKVPSELNIAEEIFKHDHKKCVEAQRYGMTRIHFMESVLPILTKAKAEMETNDKDTDNPRCYPVPQELPMLVFSWLISLWDPSSPKERDSPSSFSFRMGV